jgi:hypothetical protein
MKKIVIPAVLAFALLAAACSSGGDESAQVASLDDVPSESSPAAAVDLDQEQALLEFGECMRDQGVEFPDPTVDADGNLSFGFRNMSPDEIDRDALLEAGEECRDLLDGVALGFSQVDTSEFDDLFLEYAECMRDHGYESIPDSFDLNDLLNPDNLPFDIEDPDFVAADEACRYIFADLRAGLGATG